MAPRKKQDPKRQLDRLLKKTQAKFLGCMINPDVGSKMTCRRYARAADHLKKASDLLTDDTQPESDKAPGNTNTSGQESAPEDTTGLEGTPAGDAKKSGGDLEE